MKILECIKKEVFIVNDDKILQENLRVLKSCPVRNIIADETFVPGNFERRV